MKKTQLKDALRNIGKNRMSWISVIFITAMAAAVYLGICYAANTMQQTGDDFYETTNFRDIELYSTLFLTQEDIEALKSDSDVMDIEGIYSSAATLRSGDNDAKVDIVSLTERINLPIVLSGSLPKKADECAVEQAVADQMGYHIGDTIGLYDESDSPPAYMKGSQFRITGIVNHPDHLAKPDYTPGSRYVLVTSDAFEVDSLEGCYMKAEIVLHSVEDMDRFADSYKKKVDAAADRLETLAAERTPLRTEVVSRQLEEVVSATQELFDGVKAEMTEERKKLDDEKQQIEAAEKQLESLKDSPAAYNEALEKLNAQKARYAEDEELLNTAQTEFNDIESKLHAAIKELDDLKTCRWYFFTAHQNAGYLFLSQSAQSILSLSLTFSLFFIFIAALVIYTTIGRIVAEQRKLVGATKALGFYNREILGKYLLFAVSAVLIGALIGIALGYYLIQGVVLNAYSGMYVVGELQPTLMILRSLLVILAAALLAALAVSLSCMTLMRSTAIKLMQEKEPKARAGKGRKIGTLYSRLILRNMRSDLGRVIVTTVSVAGCCALLVTGFTMQHSATGILQRQYEEIVKFDDMVIFNPRASETAEQDIEAALKEAGAKYTGIYYGSRAYHSGDGIDSTELICGNMNDIAAYYGFKTWQTDDPLPTDAEGVFISSRTAETCGLNTGDTIVMYNEYMKPFDVKVAGIFNNYIGRNMLMNESSYERIFDKKPVQNCFLLYRNGADREQLLAKLKEISGFESFETAAKNKKNLEQITGVFTRVAILMIAIAGLMGYFILLNIMKMYINRKKRELTVMRINGFTVGEVKRYILMETVVTTILGIILGIILGALMGYMVLRFLEQPHLQFIRDPYLFGWLLGAVITAAFTFAINAFGLRKIKNLKLTDAA